MAWKTYRAVEISSNSLNNSKLSMPRDDYNLMLFVFARGYVSVFVEMKLRIFHIVSQNSF